LFGAGRIGRPGAERPMWKKSRPLGRLPEPQTSAKGSKMANAAGTGRNLEAPPFV